MLTRGKMAKKRKTNLKKLVEDAEGKNPKDRVSTLEVRSVEPVIKTQDKGNKTKGKPKNERKKPRKKPDRKTDKRAIKKGEKPEDKGEKTRLPLPDRGSDNGFKGYAW